MIHFMDVSKAYVGGGQPALQRLNFHLPAGCMAYLTGHSGAGKSTLLKLIMGMEKVTTGKIYFKGHEISHLPKNKIPFLRREIGMVHQDYRLLPEITALENVMLPLIICGVPLQEAKQRAIATLDLVQLYHRAHFYPKQLSGGEQQRVDIARAVVNRPQLLLADEPTGNLDDDLSYEIFSLFEKFNQMGMTVLIATHDIGIITRKPKPSLILEKGFLLDPEDPRIQNAF